MSAELLVVGVSHHTAPVELREQFSVSESRLRGILAQLVALEGIEEAILLSTCNRTEYFLWTKDASAATASLRGLLEREFSLRPKEWESFYCRTREEAIRHVFRVTASLDSMVVGELEITGQVKAAWSKAREAGASGRFLDATLQKALRVAKRVRNETTIGEAPVSVPYACVALARQIFGSLEDRNVMILGAGGMGELSARNLISYGARSVWVTSRNFERATKLATTLGGAAFPFEERGQHLAQADIVISSTDCPHFILGRADAERICEARQGRPLFLIDIAVPRDIDPDVREVRGFYLYDIDDLERVVARNLEQRQAAAVEAERIVAREARQFRRELEAERVVPTIVALRARLEEIRQRELVQFCEDADATGTSEAVALEALTSRMMDRVASLLANELKHVPEASQQDQLVAAVRRLFQLRAPAATSVPAPAGNAALAGTS